MERGVLGVLGSFPETSGEEGILEYFRGRGETSGDEGTSLVVGRGGLKTAGLKFQSTLLLHFLPKIEMLDNAKGSICISSTLPYSPSYSQLLGKRA